MTNGYLVMTWIYLKKQISKIDTKICHQFYKYTKTIEDINNDSLCIKIDEISRGLNTEYDKNKLIHQIIPEFTIVKK